VAKQKAKRKAEARADAEAKLRTALDVAGVDPLAALPTPVERGAFLGMLLRFISCGILALITGLIWRFTAAPSRVGVVTSLVGILALLVGFVIGGILWYIRDVRLRARAPERISDERLVFSFIVFTVVPFAVGLLVGLVWLLAWVLDRG
jgi:hypothetical protein